MQKELENHVVAENPIETSTDYFSTLSARRSTELSEAVQINRNKFILPQKLDNIVNNGVGIPRNGSTNQNCYQSHMTTFRKNPYAFGKITKVGTVWSKVLSSKILVMKSCISQREILNMSHVMTKPTNECAPSKDSDQTGQMIRVFAVHMKKHWVLSYPLSAQWRLWSDWADAQADLSLRWTHTHFVGFVMSWLIWAMSQENMSSEVCDRVRLKPACSPTEASKSFGILKIEIRGIILISRQRITKMLIRLCRCAGWSAQVCTFVVCI